MVHQYFHSLSGRVSQTSPSSCHNIDWEIYMKNRVCEVSEVWWQTMPAIISVIYVSLLYKPIAQRTSTVINDFIPTHVSKAIILHGQRASGHHPLIKNWQNIHSVAVAFPMCDIFQRNLLSELDWLCPSAVLFFSMLYKCPTPNALRLAFYI